ncbi:hypothetical protein [Carnimonas bestiolae]|uniref:hypothetical protein n=1 Tax=Carnimonas bestiolae TaxID=3402172 RepID=UPI003F4AA5D7
MGIQHKCLISSTYKRDMLSFQQHQASLNIPTTAQRRVVNAAASHGMAFAALFILNTPVHAMNLNFQTSADAASPYRRYAHPCSGAVSTTGHTDLPWL